MRLVSASEIGNWQQHQFLYTALVFECDGRYFFSQSPKRQSAARAEAMLPNHGIPCEQIPPEDIFPLAQGQDPSMELQSIDDSIHVKRNRLGMWTRGDDSFARRVLTELRICDILCSSGPHPNIARYRGYLTHEGRITSICFDKYEETLAERLERGGKVDADAFRTAMKEGLRYLHEEVGLVHNDLGPSNIMFKTTESNVPILIDFDSCMPRGGGLPLRGSHHLPKGAVASETQNDYVVLEKLCEHIQDNRHGKEWVQW